MGDIFTPSFTERRAEKANDASLLTPVDCLRRVLRYVEDGTLSPLSIAIIWEVDAGIEDGQRQRIVNGQVASVSRLHTIGLLEAFKIKRLLDEESER